MKGDPPKGFINVLQVVDIRKAQDKRQCFELLCPGIAHRLMANSQSEADEWVDSIRKMSIYQGEDSNGKALSLQRLIHQPLSGMHTPLSGSPPKLHSQSPATSRSLSVPPQPILVSQTLTGNPVTLYGTDIPPPLPPPLSQSPQNTQGMLGHLQRLYPTPPESVVTVPYPTHAPYLQKQNSLENHHPYPSPPSSDSSSMYSGSNASFDNGNNLDDEDGNSSKSYYAYLEIPLFSYVLMLLCIAFVLLYYYCISQWSYLCACELSAYLLPSLSVNMSLCHIDCLLMEF